MLSEKAESTRVTELLAEGEAYEAAGLYADAERCLTEAILLLEARNAIDDDFASFLNQLADARVAQGKFDGETERLYVRAIAIFESINGAIHPDVANVLSNLAALHQEQAKYLEAETASSRAVAILAEILNCTDLRSNYDDVTISTLQLIYHQALLQLSSSIRAQGRYAQAEKSLSRALATTEDVFGFNSREYGETLNALGVLYKYWGRYDDALVVYRQAREIFEQMDDDYPLGLATIFYNLAGLDHARGRYSEAEPLCRQALAIQETVLGADDPKLSVTQATLAAILDGQGRYDEAESLYQAAMSTHISIYGPEHPEVALILNNLGAIAEARGHIAEAEMLYSRSLGMREKFLGPDHPQVATSLNNLAMLYKAAGKPSAALPFFERAIEILTRTCGSAHPNTVVCRENYTTIKY